MRYQCSTCLGVFSDDASSSSPPERVFCVFCGMRLPPPSLHGSSAAVFGVGPRREDAAPSGLGDSSEAVADSSRRFRVRPAPLGGDSLRPVHHEPEPPGVERPVPRRFARFWTALAVGFGVGACAAVLFSDGANSRARPATATAPPPAREEQPSLSTGALPGCTVTPSASAAASVPPPPSPETKPPVTPLLEKRFWLERARSSQRQYRLAEAERFYRRALSQSPRDSEALAGLGELELLRGERGSAAARFREALEANADYVPARVALADSYWQSGDAEAARREYRELIERYSADSFPPYVAQRLDGSVCVPECGEAATVARPASVSPPAPEPRGL